MLPKRQTGRGWKRIVRCRGRPKAKRVFTECWKSCNQVFAWSSAAFSGARVNTSSAERTAWTLALWAMVVVESKGVRKVRSRGRGGLTPQQIFGDVDIDKVAMLQISQCNSH